MNPLPANAPGELLVAILNEPRDYHFARDEHWYRIPVESAATHLHDRWPPRRLAFYQTKVFAEERYSVRYFADVLDISRVGRRELFPNEPDGRKSGRNYYRLSLGPLQLLPAPIFSRRARRIIFIPSTWDKFTAALEINDLYHGSPLEDRLWAALKQRNIPAEREEYLTAGEHNYALDFADYPAFRQATVAQDDSHKRSLIKQLSVLAFFIRSGILAEVDIRP